MDFYTQQDSARRNTTMLVGFFALAVIGLILIANGIVYALFYFGYKHRSLDSTQLYNQYSSSMSGGIFDSGYTWEMFGAVSGGMLLVILLASLFKAYELMRGGGRYVAESLHGDLLHSDRTQINERKLLNVVEEMAIASGMPVPAVYIMRQEQGINAFAAGSTPADAVIGVTQGCIDRLNRAELQGVIAHEFSHILNGDMRLNIRLIGVLHGILFISRAGEFLMRSGSYSRGRNSGGFAFLGLGMLLLGWLGLLFGNLIKSAVSRQREFLADASAVQFTRNPEGIRDALRVIGGVQHGGYLMDPNAGEASHLFFEEGLSKAFSAFATHPPIEKRIAKLDPNWDGQFIVRQQHSIQRDDGSDDNSIDNSDDKAKQERQHKKETFKQVAAAAVVSASGARSVNRGLFQLTDDAEVVREQLEGLPEILRESAREPLSAIALLLCLLFSREEEIKKAQRHHIEFSAIKGLLHEVNLIESYVEALDLTWRLPLIEMALPSLKKLSKDQYRQFNDTLLRVIRADQTIDLFEWCLYQLSKHYLAPHFGEEKTSRPQFSKLNQVASEFQLVLSMVAKYGHDSADAAEKAYGRGANTVGLYTHPMLSDDAFQIRAFSQAVNKLACCYPLLKPRILKGLVDCAKHDGRIDPVEQEMISTIAAVIDCPMPTLSI